MFLEKGEYKVETKEDKEEREKALKKGRLSGRVGGERTRGGRCCALILFKGSERCHHHVRFPGDKRQGVRDDGDGEKRMNCVSVDSDEEDEGGVL